MGRAVPFSLYVNTRSAGFIPTKRYCSAYARLMCETIRTYTRSRGAGRAAAVNQELLGSFTEDRAVGIKGLYAARLCAGAAIHPDSPGLKRTLVDTKRGQADDGLARTTSESEA